MSQADHLAELHALGYCPNTLHPLLEVEAAANADAESYCGVEGFDYEAAETRTRERVAELFGGTLPAGFFVNGDPRGYALKLAEGTGSITYRDWGGFEILAPEFEPEDDADADAAPEVIEAHGAVYVLAETDVTVTDEDEDEPEDGPTFAERIGLPPGHRVTLGGEFVPVPAAERLPNMPPSPPSPPTTAEFETFAVEITLGNAAMQTAEDVAGALREIADRLDRGQIEGGIRDENGNTVGTFIGHH